MSSKTISIIVIVAAIAIAAAIYFSRTTAPQNPNAPSQGSTAANVLPKGIHFTTSVAQAPYENFNFPYPVGFLIKENDIKTDAAGVKHHVVVLAWNTPPTGTVEINEPGKTCTDYVKCEVVKGVAIGTNATDAGFQDLWQKIVSNF